MDIITTASAQIIYLLTFLIVLAETGIVLCFFLPGDTLLFTLGLLAKSGSISLFTIILIITTAGFIGNILAYYLGRYMVAKRYDSKILKKIPQSHIDKTERFYKKYGNWAVIISRFIPVVRTIAPFLGGVAKMNRKSFIVLSFIGAVVWSSVVVTAGYLFGAYINVSHIGEIGLILMFSASILTPLALVLAKKYSSKS